MQYPTPSRWLRTLGAALVAAPLGSGLALAHENSPAHTQKATANGAPTLIGAVSYPGNTASGGEIRHRIIATHEVTGTVDDDGNGNDYVCGAVWDDGAVTTHECNLSVPVGDTQTLRYEFYFEGAIGQAPPGVGVATNDVTVANPTTQDVESAPRRGNVLTAHPVLMADTLWVHSATSYGPHDVDFDIEIGVTGVTDDDGNGLDAVCLGIWIQGDNYYWDCRHIQVGSTNTQEYYPTIDFDISGLPPQEATVMFVDVDDINALPSAATDRNTVLTTTAGINVHTYSVRATVNGGNGTVSHTIQHIEWNEEATIGLHPDAGYRARVTSTTCGNGELNAAGTQYRILDYRTDDCEVVFEFRQPSGPHAITATANPAAGGSVSCDPNPVPNGGSTTCTATPAAGYTFDAFSGACTGATCVLGNVTAPASVTANFTPAGATTYPITFAPLSNGSLSCNPNPVPDGGTSVCTATPDAGYEVGSFSPNCVRTGATTCELQSVSAAQTVSASFVLSGTAPNVTPVPATGWLAGLLGALALGLMGARRRQATGNQG